jgi:predicted naringenin-chalcone synthase
MRLLLAGFGTAVPEHAMAQTDAAEVGARFAALNPKRAGTVRAIYRKSGVRKRHSVLLERADGAPFGRQSFYEEAVSRDDPGPSTELRMRRYEADAPVLAEAAARAALRDAELEAKELTHIVTVSCTGFFSPGLDAVLVDRLGLSRGVERTHIGFMGCHGALNGLRVAASFAGANPDARVLVSAVELCSLHFAYGRDPQLVVANSLFADGAAAVVGVSDGSAEAAGVSDRGDVSGDVSGAWRVLANGTLLMPDSADAMSWRIGDHGFRMTLSATVPDLIAAHLPEWLEEWLGQYGLAFDDVASWAVHPGGPRVLSAVGDALGLTNGAMEVSRDVLDEYGNMSSATVLFILERLRRRNAPRPCVALAFGPGLVVEAVLFG